MLAAVGPAMPRGSGWTFEPKYDGIRVLAVASGRDVLLLSRNGNDKSAQFPEIADAVRALAIRRARPLVIDGEIVGLRQGRLGRFQDLQGRIHRRATTHDGHPDEDTTPATLVAFDLLTDDDVVLVHEPWTTRRRHLEALIRTDEQVPALRLGETSADGTAMLAAARRQQWEGVIAKRTDAAYEMGQRSHAWLKLKVEHEQEFVVGGYTDPRRGRPFFGALLLGHYVGTDLVYAGSCGGGFTDDELRAVFHRLRAIPRQHAPFAGAPPRTRERAHWVTPQLVVQVRFNEWTADGKLRQPIYLGLRDDVDPRQVHRETESIQPTVAAPGAPSLPSGATGPPVTRRAPRTESRPAAARPSDRGASDRGASDRSASNRSDARTPRGVRRPISPRGDGPRLMCGKPGRVSRAVVSGAVDQLDWIEHEGGGEGMLALGAGCTLAVSRLGKVFFPAVPGGRPLTKGDLFRYYASIAPYLLPTIADRPLVLRRFPNGITRPAFYQQRVPGPAPRGVRIERVAAGKGPESTAEPRLIGGDLVTLLYIVQLGAVSVDPWHARVGSLDTPDYTIIDLDPGPRATFRRVIDVARWVKEELDSRGLVAALKTSGATGLHVVLPLVSGTPEDAARLVAEIVATAVAERHPRDATVTRSVRARGAATVYVDYLQNIRGKTVAGVYSARARPGATVSTPLDWAELRDDLDPAAFTIETVPERVQRLGDLWAPAMRHRNDLATLVDSTSAGHGHPSGHAHSPRRSA